MSHDLDITETEDREVTLSFTAGGAGCWIFVVEGENRNMVRLDGDSGEAVRVAQAILDFYKER